MKNILGAVLSNCGDDSKKLSSKVYVLMNKKHDLYMSHI